MPSHAPRPRHPNNPLPGTPRAVAERHRARHADGDAPAGPWPRCSPTATPTGCATACWSPPGPGTTAATAGCWPGRCTGSRCRSGSPRRRARAAELREADGAHCARAEGVREVAPDGPWPSVGLAVDALLGTGAPRRAAAADGRAARAHARPRGAGRRDRRADRRRPRRPASCTAPPRADLSITFGGLRRGHLLARDEVGDVVVADIGHPPPDPAWPRLVTDPQAAEWLRRLRSRDHKGDAGPRGRRRRRRRHDRRGPHGRRARRSRAGAGLVHAVAPPETVAALVQAEPDLQTLAHPFDQPPATALLELVGRADAVVIGPGLGRDAGRRALVDGAGRARPGRWCSTPTRWWPFRARRAELRALAAGRAAGAHAASRASSAPCFPSSRPIRELDPWARRGRGRRASRAPRCCSRACPP